MAKKIVIRRMGQTMKEGTVTRWIAADGQSVKAGQPIYELEYDKASVEVEAPCDGVLHILASEGDTLPVGETVAEVLENGEAPVSGAAPVSAAAAEPAAENGKPAADYGISASAKRMIRQNGLDASKIVPANGRRIMPEDVRAFMAAAAEPADAPAPVKASPLARKVAAELSMDLGGVNAHGRVLAEDILRAVSTQGAAAVSAAREESVPMNGMRKAIARNMLNSHMTSPTVSFNLSVEMTEMKRCREQLKTQDIKVSYTDLLVKFVAKALTEFPILNCSVEGNNIIYKHYVNMGVAVALENGLVVPHVADADRKSLTQISAEIKELSGLAREGKLPVDKLSGGTFTITNLGMYGIESFTPIINQPEVAILGVTTIEDRAVVRDGEVVVRPMMTLSLTADHRVVDGSVAAQFLQRVKNLLEKPALILA